MSIYLPTALYGSYTWALLEKYKSIVTSSEVKYLRRLEINQGKIIRNTTIRESLKMGLVVK